MAFFVLVLLAFFGVGTFLPVMIASRRNHPNRAGVIIVSIVAGVFALFFFIGLIASVVTPDFYGGTHINPLASICAFFAFIAWVIALIWASAQRGVSKPPPLPPSPPSVDVRTSQERLEALEELRSKGSISDSEYERKRLEIIAAL